MTIGIAANVYNESLALPGWLKMSEFFDDIFIMEASPGMRHSNDGTIEIIEKSGVRHAFCDINKGFAAVRSELIQRSKADFVMIMDADERFRPTLSCYQCNGEQKYPDFDPPDLRIIEGSEYNQGEILRRMIQNPNIGCLRLCRRHWYDDPESGKLEHPAQNWLHIPDWQLRPIRKSPFNFFDPSRKLHELLRDSRTWNENHWSEPLWESGDVIQGPFIEHHHNFFKPKHPEKNKEDLATYRDIDDGLSRGIWLESSKMPQSTEK